MSYDLPTIPDNKIHFFRQRLIREISNLFVWEGLENINIPADKMEYNLITTGRLMFFNTEEYGYLILPARATGFNIYNDPVLAGAITPQGSDSVKFGERNIMYEYTKEITKDKSCILLDNMLFGENLWSIIDFYARRLAMVWLSFDTNLLWQNLPPIISVSNKDMRTSIEEALSDIWDGKPVIIKDEALKLSDEAVQVGLVDVKMILKELFDVYQEIYNDFKQQVGIEHSGVDKQSGVTSEEAGSNNQHVRTALNVMLGQRKKFCKLVNKVYGLTVSVDIQGAEEVKEMEEQQDGESDNRVEELPQDS